ncbi:restriction endonuclease subunit S [Acinetobacter indicus]|nr:restriction endonuclease subunit S [Acinetobacter indicus]QFS16149.1 restriction endonuclease subunit S [Acinetobacter indicus]
MPTPKLRFKEFDTDYIETKYEKFAPLQRGFDLPVSTIIDGEYPVVFSNGILKKHNQFKVKAPGVVTGRSGTIGNITWVEKDYWPHNTSLWVTNFFDNEPKYVFYFLQEFDVSRFASGSGVPTLNRNDVHTQLISIPTNKKEQTKIASFLSAVDEKISQLTQKHALLTQYKQGMIQKLFSQEIRFKADDGSEFGEWEKTALNTLCSRSYQGINTVADKVEYQQSGYPILQAKHITSEKLDLVDVRYLSDLDYEKYKEKYIPKVNDILFSNIGTIGKVVLVGTENPFFIAWNIFLITPKETLITPLYLTSYLRWLTALNYFDNLQTGNATKFINKTDLLATVINLPCLAEQTKIANFLSAIDQKIEVVAQQIEQAKTWKKGLLQQMFV